MMYLNYKEVKKDFSLALSEKKVMAFATSYKDHVSVRSVYVVSQDLIFYLIARRASNKIKDLQRNPHVALSVDAFQIKGKANILGHPLDPSNDRIVQETLVNGPDSLKKYFKYKNAVLIEVVPSMLSMWDLKITYLDLENHMAYLK